MEFKPRTLNRRAFLETSALAAAAAVVGARSSAAEANRRPLFSKMGIAASIDRAAELKAAGAEFLTESVDRLLMPDKSTEEFERTLSRVTASPLPVLACNGFIRPAHLRCVGADANPDQVLEWAKTCFTRLKKVGGQFIVFGSAGSRRLRDGWTKEQADKQFVELLKRMGPMAAENGVTVVVEQLREQECNYINHVEHAASLIRAAAHPNIRLLADFYHIASVGDTPSDLAAAMDVITHIEIAEKANRTAPGVDGDDFRPYFKVLRDRGYNGPITIEGRWEIAQVAPAFKEIARQVAEA